MDLLVLSILIGSLFAVTDAGYSERPTWFETGDVPENSSYTIRRYKEANWVRTKVWGFSLDEIRRIGFLRLFNYISGPGNEQGIKISMTAPVTISVTNGACFICKRMFVMSFYIPTIHQDNPPLPKAGSPVYIEKIPESTFYVRKFVGLYSSDANVMRNAYVLMEDLKSDGVNNINTDSMTIAGYNAPSYFVAQSNEIWLSPLK